MNNELTWTCHICNKERPDHLIGVYKRDISLEFNQPYGTITENVRFCIDNLDCKEKAKTFRFFKK